MARVFAEDYNFHRGKGNKKTRIGPRTTISNVRGTRGEKAKPTPNDIAIHKLATLLDRPGLSGRDRYRYANLMKQAEQIRFMNMPVLAEVLLYMHSVGNVITEDNFNYNAIRPYIDRLLPRREVREEGVRARDIPENELEIMRLRMAATFLRYIRYVSLLRQTASYELEQAQEGEIVSPIIDEI